MSNIFKTFLLVLILTSSIDIVSSKYNSTDFNGFPVYTISTYSNNPVVNQGDNVSIEIFITGRGDVDTNNFKVSIPPFIVKRDIWVNSFIYDTKEKVNIVDSKIQYFDNGFNFRLTKLFFEPYEPGYLGNVGEFQYITNETKYPPLTVNFMIDNDAPPGDHQISTILFYKNASQWYMSEKIITIHIRYWYEQNWFYVVSIIVSILFILELVIRSKILNRVYTRLKVLLIYIYKSLS